MHDPEVLKGLQRNFQESTHETCIRFIRSAKLPEKVQRGDSLHYAIIQSETDEYLGTVSLKNIDIENGRTEYAIATRRVAWGKGVGYQASMQILEKAFYEIGLHRVFLEVYSDNIAAIRLYERCGFLYEGAFRDHFLINGEYRDWLIYGLIDREFNMPERLIFHDGMSTEIKVSSCCLTDAEKL